MNVIATVIAPLIAHWLKKSRENQPGETPIENKPKTLAQWIFEFPLRSWWFSPLMGLLAITVISFMLYADLSDASEPVTRGFVLRISFGISLILFNVLYILVFRLYQTIEHFYSFTIRSYEAHKSSTDAIRRLSDIVQEKLLAQPAPDQTILDKALSALKQFLTKKE